MPISEEIKDYWIHKINPISPYDHFIGVGGSNEADDAIRQCREKAQEFVGKDFVVCFRVMKHRGEVIYLALVNFDQFEEWDMREDADNGET